MDKEDLLERDLALTLANRDKLLKNKNLLYWYKNLYETQFSGIERFFEKRVLEIGSGTSPLKYFYNNVITSDIMALNYLDHKLDCHAINQYQPIPDGSIDIITMTNTLHHLQNPLLCLKNMAGKLKNGGSVIMTEPYFSFFSKIIYKYLHHEPSVFNIDKPVLGEIKGPLSSSNMAIPYMLFFSNRDWYKELNDIYDFSKDKAVYYSAFSYMATGGISRRIPMPHFLYRFLFSLDMGLAKIFPRLFSSFFIIRLVKKK